MIKSLLFVFLITVFCMGQGLAADAPSYVVPSMSRLAKTLVKVRGGGLTKEKMLNEFASLTECEIFQKYHRDDFRWKEVQKALLESILYQLPNYPLKYVITGRVDLDQYDFKAGVFHFREEDQFVKMGVIGFEDSLNFENDRKRACFINAPLMAYFPEHYQVILKTPLTLTQIPMNAEEAQLLLKRMSYNGNEDRSLDVAFYISIIRVNIFEGDTVSFSARLDAVRFFEGPDILLYTHIPPS